MKKQFLKKAATIILSLTMVVSSMGITFRNTVKEVKAASTTSSTLVWSDEFNGSSIDTSKWGYEIGTGSWGWGNNEQQYYTNRTENAYVADGALHIRAKKEAYNGSNYTSARLMTNGKFTFTYGYVEARLALPSSQGIWPAFWMLGANIGSVGWPSCGEIDIMEAINAENKTYATCHWNANGHAEYGKSTGNFDITQYHTYGLQWDLQYIRMFVDGNKIYEMYIENNTGDTEEFHRPFYLLLNVAVGGNWPGFSIDDSAFPQEMKVDYVRVYQENPSYTSSSSNNVDTNIGNGNSSNNNNNNSGGTSSTPGSGMGMDYAGSGAATAYVNDSSWTDIHYSINGGSQQNVRMEQSGTKATYTINGLNNGDTVKYWFTYCNTSGNTQDTATYTYTHKSGSSSGSTGSGSTAVNTDSGDIYIYQDINYGGASASLGLGNYTLSSLQAKGFKNDDLSSVKCPWGYKVTLYADDNFSGATKVVTEDTSWIGTDWNDRVSSIKVEKARYKIINRHSGLCLDVAGADTASGTNIQQWTGNDTLAQTWEVWFNKDDSTYVLTSAIHGKALDMDGWSKENGGNAIIWDNNNTDNQRWYITYVEDGYSFLINKHSNKSLEVGGWSTAAGGNVQQWDYFAQANQQWKFVMVN
ncbi:MAG: RICIN domain-containing protein [Eubacterium sp.]